MKEFWDNRFAAKDYIYGTLPNQYFKEKIDLLKPGLILLPGEGEGRNAVYAAGLGWDVQALDYSSEGKRKALLLAESRGLSINYSLADLETEDFGEEKYDAVALIFAHFQSSVRPRFHKNILKCLRRGGHLIMEVFSLKQLGNHTGGPQNPDLLYTPEMLKNDFKGLEFFELTELRTELLEGSFHTGMADVIRLFGRKL